MTVGVTQEVCFQIIFHHGVVTHPEGGLHQIVDICRLAYGSIHTHGNDTVHEESGKDSQCKSQEDEQGDGGGVVMDPFGMEPFVADNLEFTILFQTGVLVIDEIHQFLVETDDTEFTCRDVNLVEGNIVEVQFLDLALQRYLSPDVVFVPSRADACQSVLG